MAAEINVKPPINNMDACILMISAIMPVATAPAAYPKSLHNLNTPILFERSSGCVFSATEAKKVGYTIAVPQPNNTDKKIKWIMISDTANNTNATA